VAWVRQAALQDGTHLDWFTFTGQKLAVIKLKEYLVSVQVFIAGLRRVANAKTSILLHSQLRRNLH
jgi:hypothetical protein